MPFLVSPSLLKPRITSYSTDLLIKTALQEWSLLSVNILTSFLNAISEGIKLWILYAAVKLLVEPLGPVLPESFPYSVQINTIASNHDSLFLYNIFIVLFILVQLIQSLSQYLNATSIGKIANQCRVNVLCQLNEKVYQLDYESASHLNLGDLTDLASAAPDSIRLQIDQASNMMLSGLLIITYSYVMISLSPSLLYIAFILAIGISIVQKALLPRIRYGGQAVLLARSKAIDTVVESFNGLKATFIAGTSTFTQHRINQRSLELKVQLDKQISILSILQPLSSLFPAFAIGVIMFMVPILFSDKTNILLPSMAAFLLALQRLNGSIGAFAGALNNLENTRPTINRLNHVLETSSSDRSSGEAHFEVLDGDLEMSSVCFAYKNATKNSLNDITLRINAGNSVAFVGPSGSGKSTAANLIAGLLKPTTGSITYSGVNQSNLDMNRLRQKIGFVDNFSFIFNETILQNISLSLEPDLDKVKRSAMKAKAHDFIVSLKSGYSADAGQKGNNLSTGQCQRILLAREFYKNPSILILDEATSNLDPITEREIAQTVINGSTNSTNIIVAHRLNSIVNADCIYVFESGRIVQCGSHSQLLTQPGLYSELWNQQKNYQTNR